ncbi:MAG: esterase/lipase/thioesterase [Rhodospirillaceae bacterium]|nr:MAG: esterase/lipase/thioesterase [Rhodospirillaceae bacterium]
MSRPSPFEHSRVDRPFWGRVCVLAVFLSGLSGCGGVAERVNDAHRIAAQGGLTPVTFDGGAFVLQGFYRSAPGKTLRVYVEGDGFAWVNRTTISNDPTPRDPVALELAVRDTEGTAVLYLGRPCQYVGVSGCSNRYWTSHRFAPEVVAATSQALDQAKRLAGAERIELVGFSGGGGLVVLVAAERGDVVSLRSVAGTLDHEVLNRHHRVTPPSGSLNAADAAKRVAHLPQVHLVGGRDSLIGPYVAESYVRHAGDDRCIQVVSIAEASHGDGWAQGWPRLLAAHPPRCR